MVTATRLRDDIDEILPGVIADRRDLHQHPELGFQEVRTSRVVAERLQALGLDDIRTGIAKTGVTGLVRGQAGEGKTVLLRADMDALPIHEENDVDYRSATEGVMHACGHDAHTSMLLGIARVLQDRRESFAGTVKVLFQPAEEGLGGAEPMIEAGVLDDPPVDAVFGMHMAQEMPVGTIGLRAGPAMAASDSFRVTIKGKGGHGARPQSTIDPIVIGAYIVTALQTVVSRELNPVEAGVVTVGAFRAGEANNVIPDSAELRGTVRSFLPEIRQQEAARVEALVKGIAAAMRAEVDFHYKWGYPTLVNDPAMTDLARAAVTEVVGAEHVIESPQIMGGEDFSYFLQQRPGCFFFVGSKNEERGLVWGHHHPRFDIDEASLGIGIEAMCTTVMRYLER